MSSVSACGSTAASFQAMRPPAMDAQKAQQVFSKLDVNGDSSIDAGELSSLTDFLSEKTGTQIDADALLKAIDTDGNGSVSSTELTDNAQALFDSLRGQLMGSQQGTSTPPDADERFANLDSDGDGSLSVDEFKAGMQHGPKGPPPAGDDPGRMIASLLEMYGTQSGDATSSSMLAAA